MYKSSKLVLISSMQLLLDILGMGMAYIFAYWSIGHFRNLYEINRYFWLIIVFFPVFILLMNSFHMYNITTFVYLDRIIKNVLLSGFGAGIAILSMMLYLSEHTYSHLFIGAFILVSIVFILLERLLYCMFVKYNRSFASNNVIIVGATEIAERFHYFLKKTNMFINIIGFVHVTGVMECLSFTPLGNVEDLEEILMKQVVDEVIFTLPKSYVGQVQKYAQICEDMGITVRMVLDFYDMKSSKSYLTSIGTLPLITFYSVSQNKLQRIIKRVMDIIGAIIGILISLPVALVVIPAIKLDSKGPVFFKQPRVGINGREFNLYKFRSMAIDAEARKAELMNLNKIDGGLMFKIDKDPRVTRVGSFIRKTSIDELPQFINVLKGEMSLVGTRPPTVGEVKNYVRRHHRRISMKPGITGVWQISGRSSITNFDEVVKLDTHYIDNWSILLDIKILFKTIAVVFMKRGAS